MGRWVQIYMYIYQKYFKCFHYKKFRNSRDSELDNDETAISRN